MIVQIGNELHHEYDQIKYYIVQKPDTTWYWSYSANDFKRFLLHRFSGQKIRHLYVALDGYLDSLRWEQDLIDLSYMGGSILVMFENFALDLLIHGEGLFQYRLFEIPDISLIEKFGYPPEDMIANENYFFDANGHDLSIEYEGSPVNDIIVRGSNIWAYDHRGFDTDIAENAVAHNDLTNLIEFRLSNCTSVQISGDENENSVIRFGVY